jgi:CHAT domain-containing protein
VPVSSDGVVAADMLRLRVGMDSKIRVVDGFDGCTQEPQRVRYSEAEDPLHARTIAMLIDMARHNRLRDGEYELLGSYLYSVLLENAVGEALHARLQRGQTRLVRVVLEFEGPNNDLATWPWEYLHCPKERFKQASGYFLSQLTKLVLIRNLPTGSTVRLTVEEPPVKILFIASRPQGMPVSYESMLETLHLLAEGNPAIELREIVPMKTDPDGGGEIAAATYRDMIAVAEEFEPHMIHIVAHGRRSGDDSELAFMDRACGEHWISEKRIAQDLSNMALPSLRFVFLEACESALGSGAGDNYAGISGIAMQLAHAGIPAVVGMQYQVGQGDANVFASAFYEALLDHQAVDVSVVRARRKLDLEDLDRATTTRPAFGLPVLYLRDATDPLFPPDEVLPGGMPPRDAAAGAPASPRLQLREEPPAPSACPRCDEPCDKGEKYCDRCRNYLKCPRCQWPVTRSRRTCGNCSTSLQIEHVPLDPPRGVRAQAPSEGGAGSWAA